MAQKVWQILEESISKRLSLAFAQKLNYLFVKLWHQLQKYQIYGPNVFSDAEIEK